MNTQKSSTGPLNAALDELNHCGLDIQGSEVVTKEGLSLAFSLPVGIDENWVAAMSAALVHLSRHAANRVLHENIMEVILRSNHGWLIAVPCADKAVLVVIVPLASDLAVVFKEVENAAAKIAGIL